MTFEEKWKELTGDDPAAVLNYNGGKLLWEAATYAASVAAGDRGNEAEKDARRKVAVMQIAGMRHWDAEQADLIIQKAQG